VQEKVARLKKGKKSRVYKFQLITAFNWKAS
jgi:hypothetical protein